MKGLVSVIIPNYNHARFLPERIESVLEQRYVAVEVILLDDHSDDDSREVMERYRGNGRVREIYYNEENSGSPFYQWKKGIEMARGEYVWIAESDDAAKPDLLTELVTALEADPANVIAFCESTSDHAAFCAPDKEEHSLPQTFRGEDFLRSRMLNTPAIRNASAVVFRRAQAGPEALNEILNYTYAGDWAFWCSLLLRGSVVKSGRTLNFFRRHPDSVARQADKAGLFVREGFWVMGYLKHDLQVALPFHAVRVWGSVWAQYYIHLRGQQTDIFRSNLRAARRISPILPAWFFFYLIKFKFFSPLNIPK